MTKKLISAAILLLSASLCMAEESMEALTERVFNLARKQYTLIDSQLPAGKSPRTVAPDGSMQAVGITQWTSGFFPGSLWYIYEYGGDEEIKAVAARRTLELADLIELKTDHDIGFMINCSYGNALRLTKDTASFKGVLLKAADKLAARYNPNVGAIRSWDGEWTKKWDFPVIIDNMMNLELLMNAYRLNGEDRFREIAEKHATTTQNNHFRSDYSCYHLVDYSSTDGGVIGKQTHQGHSDESTWARGEAWALYGFTMMYLKTGNEQFYLCADNVAKLLARTLPEDGIPFWDFECPGSYRDASAAAIMASAFVRLYELSGMKKYLNLAEKQIRALAGKDYLAEVGENGGFLLKHSVGNLPGGREIDVPLPYADYYFLEALLRYRNATRHPRLFIDDNQFSDLRKQVTEASNPALSGIHRQIMEEIDNFPDDHVEWKLDASGKRILGLSRKALRRLAYNAYAFRFTGEKKYLDGALSTIDDVCAMPDWNAWHFLDVAELAAGLGIAYDWLYNELTPETRSRIESTILTNAIYEALDLNKAWFYDRHHNWNQVCNGGLVIGALATREANGQLAGNVLHNAVRCTRREISKIYAPDGCYSEGPGYWVYGNEYQVLMHDAFDSVLGDDFGLGGMKGFDKAADYIVNCYGAAHEVFNYSDNSSVERPSIPVWYFAYRYDKPYLLQKEIEFLDEGKYYDSNCSFLPIMAGYAARIKPDSAANAHSGLYVGDGDNPIVTIRGELDGMDDGWYLGIKGGKASNNHGHADQGSFVFDRNGIRWAADPGAASYTDSENALKAKGGNFWLMDQESLRWTVFPLSNKWHNTLTVNGHLLKINGKATISGAFSTASEAGATVDMTDVFDEDLEKAVRIFRVNGEGVLNITDELRAKAESEVVFTLITAAEVKLNGRGAVLCKEGKTARLHANGTKCEYSVMKSREASERGFSVIQIRYRVPSGKNSKVCFTLE